MRGMHQNLLFQGGLGAIGLCLAGITHAAPQLLCQVTYAGQTVSVRAQPVQDPYPVPAVNIRGRFRFKPVVVGTPERVDRVLIYVYAESRPHPVLLQQARYLPPFDSTRTLTGLQRLYAGPLERELIYSCDCQETPP